MSSPDEQTTAQGQSAVGRDNDQRVSASARGDDQAHRTAPPGNPETDRDAVEKGEENLDRVAGR
jgi:hypothetical protein